MELVISVFVISYIYLVYKSKDAFHMLQQNLYNMNNRYLKWIFKHPKDVFKSIDFIAIIFMIVAFVREKYFYLILAFVVYLIGIFIVRKKNIKKSKITKKPLVVTARVKRLIVTMSIVYLSLVVIYYFNQGLDFLLLIVLSVMIYFNYFVLFILNIINKPIERCVYLYYYHSAITKLRSMNSLKVVGITGSYGKTSSKNILNDILSSKFIPLATPKNLNTEYGLMITINNHLDKFNDIFIAEMGAYKRGEIKILCDLVKPKFGILTTIGTAHLETFGSEENIQKTKFELIESLPDDGACVLNGDDDKQLSYKIKSKCKKIWIGINNHDVDIYATNIKGNATGSVFDVYFKDLDKTFMFETKLLGNNNIYNILAGIALGYHFGMSIEEIKAGVRKVKPIEHRLELKKIGQMYMIDDAYNSNPVGARMALDVLDLMPGDKVVVTPGMIELGKREDEYNREFGKQIASSKANYVILVGKNKSKAIYDGLIDGGYDKDKIIILNDVKEAYSVVYSLKGDKDIYALFENDLPDTYNEK